MARISGKAWDILYEELKVSEKKVPGIMDRAIKAAADVYVEEQKKAMRRMAVYRTGELSRATRHGPIIRLAGGRIVQVWPQGKRYDNKHPSGERNETIAYVNIHGRKYRWSGGYKRGDKYASKTGYAGRDYMDEAARYGDDKAANKIGELLNEVFE